MDKQGLEQLEAILQDWAPPKSEGSRVESYLARLRSRFLDDPDFLPKDWDRYINFLNRHFSRMENHLQEGEGPLQNLVLGNVQSGKTGHLMANICWAHDQRFTLVILLSGTKNTLDEQTAHRLNDLGPGFNVLPTPTQSDSKTFNIFVREIQESIRQRAKSASENLTVVTLIKQTDRLESLASALEMLQEPSNGKILIIDDEADQASPDAEANLTPTKIKKDRSIHKLLGRLVEASHGKVIYLSYTATPQAILHQDLDSFIQPRFCSIVPSGPSYFGLKQLLDEPEALAAIEGIHAHATQSLSDDEHEVAVLESAFIEFLITSWLHKFHQSSFHDSHVPCTSTSIQMLVHPSGKQEDHGRFKSQLDILRADLLEELRNKNMQFISDLILPIYSSTIARLGRVQSKEIKTQIQECLTYIVELLESGNRLQVRLVNSTERARLKRINKEKEFLPVSDQDWNKSDAWVLIGGDILGRGLTIPHLVSTFFLRYSKSPNFDTSVQQMRFCGYRNSYKHLIRVYAPMVIVRDYSDAAEIDTHLRALAEEWDIGSTDLLLSPPPIRFASNAEARYSPARKNVISLAIHAARIGGTAPLIETRRIASRNLFDKNIQLLKKVSQVAAPVPGRDGMVYVELSPSECSSFLFEWKTIDNDHSFASFASLLDASITQNSWTGIPIKLVVDRDLISKPIDQLEAIESPEVFHENSGVRERVRTLSDDARFAKPGDWQKGINPELERAPVKALVGDAERSIRDIFPGEITLIARSYSLLHPENKTILAKGVALVAWAPESKTKVLVHGEALK